ncbi:hypothetical protein, partial [Mobiluncus mulieris]|uniref:hypothetical protein n=1 Tax=Mobiluncus mulieris TaxID=2052 RepID=UPI0021E455A0
TKAADATPTAIFLPKFIIKTPFIWVKTSHPLNHPPPAQTQQENFNTVTDTGTQIRRNHHQ